MIGRADIEGSKSDVAMNAWPPQASYPCDSRIPLVRASSELSVEWRPKRTTTTARAATEASQQGRSAGGQGTGPSSDPGTGARTPSVHLAQARHVSQTRFPTKPDTPRSSEPILIPKLRIQFTDFLTYISLSTRGSSPWRPAADMGTNRRDTSTWPSPGFSRSEGKIRTPPQLRCSSRSKPYLPARGFQGTRTLIQKRKLFPDLPTASPGHFGLPRRTLLRGPELYAVPLPGSGIGTGFPFARRACASHSALHIISHCISGLGSTDSCATAVHTKPFSTSVLQGLAGVFATTTKICTDGGSRQARAQTLLRTPSRPSYSSGLRGGAYDNARTPPHLPLTAEYRLDASAPSIFRASCFGSNQRLSWCPMSVELGALTLRLVHPTAPVLLTKNGPLGTLIRDARGFIVQESQRSHPFKV
ncbi:hypothetical protein P5V15_002920 [Pogonomyrmex californicus]